MSVTIHSHRSFLIADERGDISGNQEMGFFSEDTRCMSSWQAFLGGEPLLAYAARATRPCESIFVLTNPPLPGLSGGTLPVVRRHVLTAGGWSEILSFRNYSGKRLALKLELKFSADFAHIFEVKRAEHTGKQVSQTRDQKITVHPSRSRVTISFVRGEVRRRTVVSFSKHPADLRKNRAVFRIRLNPKQAWDLRIHVSGLVAKGGKAVPPATIPSGIAAESVRERLSKREKEYRWECPPLQSDDRALEMVYDRSARDIASLRIKGENASGETYAIAAGIPWYLALFGRDTLITTYQTLPFFGALARGSLLALAHLQGRKVDRVSAEEPGKIVHEYRTGDLVSANRLIPKFPYYGTIDATPLFIIVLHEYWRWTADHTLVESLKSNLERALDWIDGYGDRDGDGYLEYQLDSRNGLANQGWKDSWDSIRFRDGRIAEGAIAVCEVQGYAYDAKLRGADLMDVLGFPERAKRLRKEAHALRQRFNRDFWLGDRGTFALALDGEKRKVDSLTSNPGHLLWSGIADAHKARGIVRTLMADSMFTGYGIRTMAAGEGGFNPISYHNGSVWPHDNSLIAAGMARYGFRRHAGKVIRGLLDAADYSQDKRLPELFAGYGRQDFGMPVGIPTACRPQAWAAGAVMLFVQILLGAVPHAEKGRLDLAPLPLDGIHHLRVEGLRLGDRRITVLSDGNAAKSESRATPEGVWTHQNPGRVNSRGRSRRRSG